VVTPTGKRNDDLRRAAIAARQILDDNITVLLVDLRRYIDESPTTGARKVATPNRETANLRSVRGADKIRAILPTPHPPVAGQDHSAALSGRYRVEDPPHIPVAVIPTASRQEIHIQKKK
jgi:hypothetical protein